MAYTRRKFLGAAAVTSAGAWIQPSVGLALPQPALRIPADFKLQILATNWGFQGSHDAFCAKAKAAGYDGVEIWIPGDEKTGKNSSKPPPSMG